MNEDQNIEAPAEVISTEQSSVDRPDAEIQAEAKQLYEDLGIKKPVPTGKAKGRPKADDGGDKKAAKQDDASVKPSAKGQADDSADESKTAPDTDKSRSDGDDSDTSSKEVSKTDGKDGATDGKVSDNGKDDEARVSKDEPSDNDETGETSGQDAEKTDDGVEEVKRPGKSNPEVEKRFQRLTSEVKQRDEAIEKLSQQLEQLTTQQREYQTNQEDPEYTIEDFRKVRDENGEVFDLDDNQAELAWRRWQDGYNQRKTEREAQYQHEQAQLQQQQEYEQQRMQKSVEAYDTLTGLIDSYPELDKNSPEFDAELSSTVLPIIKDLIEYEEGTEPGNEQGLQPVVVGMKMNPNSVLQVINKIRQSKRNLPLNGLSDTVESRSNVNVPHSRSSDPTVNQANELMKELGINKRF